MLMKHLPLIFFLFVGSFAAAQVTITIKPTDTILCYRDSVAIESVVSGAGSGKLSYQWQLNFIGITGATDSIFSILTIDTDSIGLYRCILYVDGVAVDTSNDALLRMHPKLKIDSLYRYNELGCYKDCKGQFKATVTGGTPMLNPPYYEYRWNAPRSFSQDTLVLGLCPGSYKFTVTDSMGCKLDSMYLVDALKSPKIEIAFDPKDTIYITKPYLTVSFPDSMYKYISNWTWDFGDSVKIPNQNPSTHIYESSGQMKVKLLITDVNGCDTIYEKELTIKIAKLEIPNVFTPNGDYINDKFEILLEGESKTEDYRQAYISNEFMVYDRWGRKVYSQANYQSADWDGGNLSDGIYYYVLQCIGQWSDESFHGSVTILRGKN